MRGCTEYTGTKEKRGRVSFGAENFLYRPVFNSCSSGNGFDFLYQSVSCLKRRFAAGGAEPRYLHGIRSFWNAGSSTFIRYSVLYWGHLKVELICNAAVIAVRSRNGADMPGRVIFLAFFYAESVVQPGYKKRSRGDGKPVAKPFKESFPDGPSAKYKFLTGIFRHILKLCIFIGVKKTPHKGFCAKVLSYFLNVDANRGGGRKGYGDVTAGMRKIKMYIRPEAGNSSGGRKKVRLSVRAGFKR